MIHYEHCPVCNGSNITPFLSARDYTVSSEIFDIAKCVDCTAMFTQDVPEQDAIGAYYASESYVSHSDTQKGLINKLYHVIRRRTLASKRRLVEAEVRKTSGHILDIGCGTGAFLNEMLTFDWNITGLEPDPTARAKADELFGIKPEPSNELFELTAQKYDAITMWHVLEHVHQLQEYITKFTELLATDGLLFVAVPNYTSHDAEVYGEYWAAYDVPRHLYHFSPQSMETLMQRHGLQVVKMEAMWYDSFYVSMLSEQYKNGRGNMVSAFFTGLKSNFKAMKDVRKCSSVIYVIGRKPSTK